MDKKTPTVCAVGVDLVVGS